MPGFEGCGGLSDDGRAALLEKKAALFVYEHKYDNLAETWRSMLGAYCDMGWKDAMDSGIVLFSGEGVELNYIVTDSEGELYTSGDFIVVPACERD